MYNNKLKIIRDKIIIRFFILSFFYSIIILNSYCWIGFSPKLSGRNVPFIILWAAHPFPSTSASTYGDDHVGK